MFFPYCVNGLQNHGLLLPESCERGKDLIYVIVSSSTIDKIYEIYTFYENRYEIYTFYKNRYKICIFYENFVPIFVKSADFVPIFVKSVIS